MLATSSRPSSTGGWRRRCTPPYPKPAALPAAHPCSVLTLPLLPTRRRHSGHPVPFVSALCANVLVCKGPDGPDLCVTVSAPHNRSSDDMTPTRPLPTPLCHNVFALSAALACAEAAGCGQHLHDAGHIPRRARPHLAQRPPLQRRGDHLCQGGQRMCALCRPAPPVNAALP